MPPQCPELDRAIERVRRRANLALAASTGTKALVWGLLGYGALVVVVRSFAPGAEGWLALGTAGVLGAAAVRARGTRRIAYGSSEAAAWLDVASKAGGRILTWTDVPDPRLLAPELALAPPPRLAPAWYARRVVPPALFLVAAFAVPAPRLVEAVAPRAANPLARADLDRLEERIERLAAEEDLPPAALEDLKEELRRLEEDQSREPFAEANLEGIDALGERVENLVQEKEDAVRRTSDALAEVERSLGAEAAPEEMGERREDLERAIRDLAARGGLENAPRELKDALGCKDGRPGKDWNLPEDPTAMKEALDQLGKFCQGEWKDEPAFREGEGPGGRGGVDRGPGAAPLVFGEKSPELAEALKEEYLPPGSVSDLENSDLLGVSFGTPKAGPTGDGGTAAAGDLGSGPGGAVWGPGVGVRERRILDRYFSED